jgi:Acyl-CoA dehydrogenase, C-terminal domain
MNLDPTADQLARLDRLRELVDDAGGSARAFEISRANGFDQDLDQRIADSDLLTAITPLDAVLLVHEAARLGLAVDLTTRALLVPALGPDLATAAGPIAAAGIADPGGAQSLVRFGTSARQCLVLAGPQVRLIRIPAGSARPTPSSFGYPYARLDLSGGEPLPAADAGHLRRLQMLGFAAEAAGAAEAAVAQTAAHLRTRRQFGQPLAHFQALRHRLAEAHVSAQSVAWLARAAAWSLDPQQIHLAATTALDVGRDLPPALIQLCGARGFTLEFGLHVATMRLSGIRLELGSLARIAEAVGGYDAHLSGQR